MTRNLKALGLALLAAFALSAVAASASSAHIIRLGEATGVITAEGNNGTFGTKSSSLSVTCEKETYHGTAKDKATEVTVHPVYDNCTAKPFGSAPVDTEGCDYILYGETTEHLKTDGVTKETDAPVTIECTEGSVIKITAPGCTIKIGNQAGVHHKLHGVTYDTEGSGTTKDLKVTETVDTITYTSEGGLCGLAGVKKEGEDGFLTGSVTAKAFKDEDGTAAAHQFTFKDGAQISLTDE